MPEKKHCFFMEKGLRVKTIRDKNVSLVDKEG
jgi:hypothetical protein